MTGPLSDKQQLKAFINAAQYFAGLTSGQDIWEEAGKVLVNFFGADFGAFGRYGADGEIEIRHWAFSGRVASAQISQPQTIKAVRDVFESGFLTFLSLPSDDPIAVAFFPVHHESRVIAVMLVGQLSCVSLQKEILDLYLAVAGIIGAKYSRKISEAAVLQAKEDWEQTFDAVPDMIAIIDLNYRVVRANKSMADRLGLKPEECVGLTCHQAFHGTDETPVHCPYSLLIEDGLEHTVEIHLDRDYLISVSPLYDNNGRLTGSVHVARDITEFKQAENELQRFRTHLQKLVDERTAELTAANEELEGFSYSVSHDLRAPIRHMIGFMELLEKRCIKQLDETSLHYMTTVSKSAKKLGMLIDDLLAFSRAGRAEMKKKRVRLFPLVTEAVQEIEDEVKGRHITWEIEELPEVYGDQTMLGLALSNLIHNAAKFTRGRQQSEIKIGCRDEGDEFIFFVKDNGAGFDMKYVDKLFGVFQRLHHQDEFEGTGIGLANVRRIISRHGGRTWAEGSVGQGATFYFSLPKKTA